MSKAALRKELQTMSREQLQQIILDAYEARKETKEYFDFFLNPNVEKLKEKYFAKIQKELNKSKRRMCKARVSVIKKALKDFISFGVEPTDVIKVMGTVLMSIGYTAEIRYLPDTIHNYITTLTKQIKDYGNENLITDEAMRVFATIINDKHVPRYIINTINQTLSE